MLRLPNLAEELAGRGQQAQRLLLALATALLEQPAHGEAAGRQLLQDLAATAPLAEHAEALAGGVLARAGRAEGESEGEEGHLQQMLRCARRSPHPSCLSATSQNATPCNMIMTMIVMEFVYCKTKHMHGLSYTFGSSRMCTL